jgi:hypothetical protein|tara:strand:- start:234 stop:488 length:255 start_codon:yes stop_codon:yes gene_type:complete
MEIQMEYIIIAVVAVAVVYFGFIKKDESKPASGGHGKPSAPRTPPALKVAKKKPAPKKKAAPKKTVAKKTAPKKTAKKTTTAKK